MKRRVVISAAASAFAASAAAGCLLTTNFDGIVGTPPPPVDASADQTVAEAGGDTGGGDASDGYAPLWCATQPGHALCADFDEDGGTLLGAWWTGPYDQSGGTSTLDTTNFTSPPAAFLSNVPASGAGGLIRSLPVSLTDFHYAFDFRVDPSCTPKSNAAITFASVGFQSNIPSNIMGVLLGVSGWFLVFEQPAGDGGSTVYPFALSPAPSRDAWHRLKFDVTLGASGHVTATLDGASVVDSPVSYEPVQNGTVLLNAGVFGPGPCTADYDDMTFDFNTSDGG